MEIPMSEPQTIKILLVDDHPMVRKGLSAFLDVIPGLEEIGVASNGAEAIRFCEQADPDVILMDLVMPEIDGIEATRQIKQKHPQIKIIAMTSFQEDEFIIQAFDAGATNFLMKDVSLDDLEAAIRSAYKGTSTISTETAKRLIKKKTAEQEPDFSLTSREVEVLALIVNGLTNREIADRLVISRATASVHVSNILAKLGVSNRVEATSLAIRHKLVG
jgi:NarL family two-component system response regulator LiaR